MFKKPSEIKSMEVHPRAVQINGNEIAWNTSENKIKENVEWLDKYIKQANEKYDKLLAKREEEKRKLEERQTKEKEEPDRLNEKFKDL